MDYNASICCYRLQYDEIDSAAAVRGSTCVVWSDVQSSTLHGQHCVLLQSLTTPSIQRDKRRVNNVF